MNTKIKKDGSANFLCKYCNSCEEIDFKKGTKSLCIKCTAIVRAVKNKECDKEKRISTIKLIMQDMKSLSSEDEITHSEVPTGTLLDIANDYKNMRLSMKTYEKEIEKLKKKISKLEDR